jgi:hypothetical protein
MQKYLIHHLADLPGAEIIFAEQAIRIINSGILTDNTSYHICVNGSILRFESVIDQIQSLYDVTVVTVANDCNQGEYPTLHYLHNLVHKLPTAAAVGYIHLKGAGRPGHAEVQDWRRLMEFFIIDNYQHCVKWLLNDYNVVGCNWTPVSWIKPHFSGNFWWANSDYINSLKKLSPPSERIVGACSEFSGLTYGKYWSDVWNQIEDRGIFDHECWITSGNYKQKSLFDSRVDHYQQLYPESKYINYTIE